jgi:hypothetical protein
MRRLLLAAAILLPTMASAAPPDAASTPDSDDGFVLPAGTPNPMPPCGSPKMEHFISEQVNQMLSGRGFSIMKFYAPPVPLGGDGWDPYRKVGHCMIAFQNTDGMPIQGIFTYRYNMVGQMIVEFQDTTQY